MKGVQCFELLVGIALKNYTFFKDFQQKLCKEMLTQFILFVNRTLLSINSCWYFIWYDRSLAFVLSLVVF